MSAVKILEKLGSNSALKSSNSEEFLSLKEKAEQEVQKMNLGHGDVWCFLVPAKDDEDEEEPKEEEIKAA